MSARILLALITVAIQSAHCQFMDSYDVIDKVLDYMPFRNSMKDHKPARKGEPFLKEDHDDRFKTIQEVIEENDYVFHEYNVTTEDGYILTMHRVQNRSAIAAKSGKAYPIFMMHGIEDSSFMWVQNTPSLAPAFVFADAGFDVWLGNNRGNLYSQAHVHLDKSQKEFWDFDFEEMGLYDVPACADFILEATKDTNPIDKIAAYIGFSEGTTQFFIGSSMKPEYYTEKFNLYVAWAPIVRLGNDSFMGAVSKYEEYLIPFIQDLKLYNIYQSGYYSSWVEQYFCQKFRDLCQFFDEGYFDRDVDNEERLPVKMAHSPEGAGWRNLIHYAQIIKSQRFQRFDFGPEINMKKYGQVEPPLYDLSKINIKFAIGHGDLDSLSDLEHVAWLLNEKESGLRVKELMIFQKLYHFGHGTYGLALDGSFLYDDFVPLVEKESASYREQFEKDHGVKQSTYSFMDTFKSLDFLGFNLQYTI